LQACRTVPVTGVPDSKSVKAVAGEVAVMLSEKEAVMSELTGTPDVRLEGLVLRTAGGVVAAVPPPWAPAIEPPPPQEGKSIPASTMSPSPNLTLMGYLQKTWTYGPIGKV
jgi:hypothetical protein